MDMDVYANGQATDSNDAAVRAGEATDPGMKQAGPETLQTVEALQKRLAENPNHVEIAIEVAKELRNLCGSPGVGAQQAVAALGYIQAEYGESEEVLEELARGLAMLIASADEMTGMVYKSWLQSLIWGYPKLADVAAEYIKLDA